MKYLEKYTHFDKDDIFINVLLDASSSITKKQVRAALYITDFGVYDKVNFVKFTYTVEEFKVLDDVDKILNYLYGNGFGSRIMPAIELLYQHELQYYKTFIISDLYFGDNTVNYSRLKDYQLVKLEDDPDELDIDYSIPKEDYLKNPEMYKNSRKYNI